MSRFREGRDASGNLSFVAGPGRLAAMADALFHDLERDEIRTVAEIYGLQSGGPEVASS